MSNLTLTLKQKIYIVSTFILCGLSVAFAMSSCAGDATVPGLHHLLTTTHISTHMHYMTTCRSKIPNYNSLLIT